MENLEIKKLLRLFEGKRVLVTGHTGFKGSWLALWLHHLGAKVSGIALDPDQKPDHFSLLNLPIQDLRIDIRNRPELETAVKEINPEMVFHLAAQPLVRRSYREPIHTWETNVMGSIHLLEAIRNCSATKAAVFVTTDKVYKNQEWDWGYRENDPLGGHDPYSYSKSAMEFAIDCYRQSYFQDSNAPAIASARAGNVIGGGDWSEDRLIPDLVRAVANGKPIQLRYPQATRPWQHVLECLWGYLMLAGKLWNNERNFAQAWNFGPVPEDNRMVIEVLSSLKIHWPDLDWKMPEHTPDLHESGMLYLDHSKAKRALGWKPVWSLDHALKYTAEWYKSYYHNQEVLSKQQLQAFMNELSSSSYDARKNPA